MQRIIQDPVWLKPFIGFKQFDDIKTLLHIDKTNIQITGLSEQAKCHMVASLLHSLSSNCLYVTYSEHQAKRIHEDLEFYFPDKVLLFPARETFFYSTQANSNEVSEQRLKALVALAQNEGVIVVASYEALLYLQTDIETFLQSIFIVKSWDELDLSSFIEKLVGLGYERVDIVEGAGQFSVRGGIVDFFPTIADKPCRIELFDDFVDSIREFDPVSQRSTEKVQQVVISPARELVLTKRSLEEAGKRITHAFDNFANNLIQSYNGIYKRLKDKTETLLEAINDGSYTPLMDSFFNFFYPEQVSAINYLNTSAIIILDEPTRIEEYSKGFRDSFAEQFKDLLEQGDCLPEQAHIVLGFDKLLNSAQNYKKIKFEILSAPSNTGERTFNFAARSIPSYQGNLYMLCEDINVLKSKKYTIAAVLSTQKRAEAFLTSLRYNGIDALLKENFEGEFVPGQVYAFTGNLPRGFEYQDVRLFLISEQDIYGVSKRRERTRHQHKKLTAYTDFKVGDYVVHENHGIGKYVGLETLVVEGRKRDYLNIRYAGTDKLYVPTDQLESIQPYGLVDDLQPKLSKLGGADWQKTKARVNESVKKLAVDLLKLYAERQSIRGHRFSADTDWQRQFELSFPYEETPDQLQAAEDIKRDMESSKVMDRLLCGDVGYGKTEVAIRAAFKTTIDNKQVAVLAPTTILAQQHYNTFLKRFEHFPFKIDVLSRFKTEAQQKSVIGALKEGRVDVVIGTHRLLGKDVKFKDLGLLIVDEEQRFGVSHKEILKNIKKNVDVLTLTATPIPRTLHMSLSGIRDISVIESPPEGRYPVQTYVVEYDEPLIRDIILKEVSRGGQVYFVYNRVKSMEFMAESLRNLVPGVRIAIAHGQMSENILEEVMMEFYNNNHDLLLCSSIIENGLDIPNVNTLIVCDCDHFGLSQLYQLRGRVGRSNRRAYAYFVYRKDKTLTETASMRLRTIKEFTEFGAGFKIAMRDMEIRGAGNIMGAEQHGHMVAIGYDMYYRLLKKAVAELKGDVAKRIETLMDIKANAHIDEEYIPDQAQRIGIYKRIAAIECEEDKNNVEEELEDRFGEPPEAVRNLVDIAFAKALGMRVGVLEISHESKTVRIKMLNESVNPRKIMTLINENRGKLDYLSSNPPVLALKVKDTLPTTAIEQVKEILIKMDKLFVKEESAVKANR